MSATSVRNPVFIKKKKMTVSTPEKMTPKVVLPIHALQRQPGLHTIALCGSISHGSGEKRKVK